MSIKDSIASLEQQIFVACSEGDFDRVYALESRLDRLRGHVEHLRDHPFDGESEYYIEPDEEL
ncbi:hypothetical protein HGP28_10880 [Vibrio sp. SM6]|uniref:Uncharacterized protein n=1 Tax=Vibrio agarilyticus TaxID=2726741 RepID=A0A7X8TRQ3_9VIBR|nr:hypothetical protein [Vibrio agarilyticus]NLS13397.1 hypothetical protein [Vibrio agarilyticus]